MIFNEESPFFDNYININSESSDSNVRDAAQLKNRPFNDDFLLRSEVASKIYYDYVKDLPIIDYHCHIVPKEIADDISFENITKLWLGADHYKWRYMRACGVDEKYITGDASDKEKFDKWIDCLSFAVGNPLYHWSHLELKKYFGINGYVTPDNKDLIWERCNKILASGKLSARKIIENSNVQVLCTTDDPADSLEYHEKIAADASFKTKVFPAFRPDCAMNLDNPDYESYIEKLAKASGHFIESFDDLKSAIVSRIDYFDKHGCTVADHGFDTLRFRMADDSEIDLIFKKRLSGESCTEEEIHKFRTAFLLFVGAEYVKRDWVSQLHFAVKRENNDKIFAKAGANAGIDCINNTFSAADLADFLNASSKANALPKTIVYSLNPNDNALIDTVIACFQDSSAKGKLQHGSAWWFNDNLIGMESHLETLASLSSLNGFVGMLTDSRSFVSYTRHDYFRRILCAYLGRIAENGEFPKDYSLLGKIAENVSYKNALNYFNFKM